MNTKRKSRIPSKKYRSYLAEGHRPLRGADVSDPVRNQRTNMPVNSILRSMANKIVSAPFVRAANKITLADIEKLRPAFLVAYKGGTMQAFLKALAEERGHSAGWWRQAFYGRVRLS